MGFSPLADMSRRIQPGGRQSTRNSAIRGFTIHHQAGVNAHGQASAPGREVSANYWITNEGVIIPNIDENMRAWTTGAPGYPAGAQSDHRNITVEVSNSPEGVRNGTWAISAAAQSALERLIGDVFRRHNLGPVRRGTHGGVAVHQDFVPTACPGPYIMGRLGSIIANAERARSGGGAPTPPKQPKGGTKVLMMHRNGRYAVFGPNFWFVFGGSGAAKAATLFLIQMAGTDQVWSFPANASMWNAAKKAARTGTNE